MTTPKNMNELKEKLSRFDNVEVKGIKPAVKGNKAKNITCFKEIESMLLSTDGCNKYRVIEIMKNLPFEKIDLRYIKEYEKDAREAIRNVTDSIIDRKNQLSVFHKKAISEKYNRKLGKVYFVIDKKDYSKFKMAYSEFDPEIDTRENVNQYDVSELR